MGGTSAAIRKAEVRKQKHDWRDAEPDSAAVGEERFPAIWLPTGEQRTCWTLLLHQQNWCACG
jgi:hypothetical protein